VGSLKTKSILRLFLIILDRSIDRQHEEVCEAAAFFFELGEIRRDRQCSVQLETGGITHEDESSPSNFQYLFFFLLSATSRFSGGGGGPVIIIIIFITIESSTPPLCLIDDWPLPHRPCGSVEEAGFVSRRWE
jgi:hypothetical protein